MVFENLVAYLLDKYLSDYIENLDTKKLKVDLWSGNVVLENLYLKPNALADLNLPVTISLGYLEKLTLQVPWKNIYTQSTKATIDGLFLLVVPKTEVEYDAKRDEKEQHEAKMKEVYHIEELRKEQEAQKNAKSSDKNNDTFAERMQLQVIRNLELSIRNIHVVYEDKSTKPNHPFAFGFTLNYITLHTTTPDWKPTILKEDTPLIHKLGDLSALSIYWNTDAQSRSGLSRDEALKNLRQRIAVNNQQTPTDISYILRPLNIKARIVLAMKPRQEEFKRPMFDIKVDLDEFSLNINRDQYSDLLDLLEFRDYLSIQTKYIKYHINIGIQEKPSTKRWKFAYEAIVNEEIRPRFECYKWENIKLHLDRCREYRSLHFQELLGKATVEQKQRAQELEKNLDVFNLTYIRRSAEIEAKKKKDQEPKTWWGSVSNWWGGNKPPDNPELDFEKVMSPEEKKKLYDAIGYEGEDTSTSTYPEEFIDIDLAIQLNLLDVNVWSKINENDAQFRVIARAAIPDTNLVFKRRPATSAIAVFVDLGSFQVFGIATDLKQSDFSNDNRPVLAQPVSRSLSTSNQQKLLQVEFETNPLDKSSDYRVKVVSQSLEIKYNAQTINKLAECFEQDTQRNLQGVKQAAYSTYTDVKHRSYILMKHNVEKIKVLDIDIDLQSSYFLLPENGVYRDGAAAICMDFGHLTLKRSTKPSQNGEQATSLKEAKDIEEARERSYTQFKLKLENIQLIYANQNESWEKARQEKNTNIHLIKPMELDLDVGKCIYSDDAVLPAWKVAGKLPSVDLRLSDKRLFQIMTHMQSIPFPESKHPVIVAQSIEPEPTLVPSSLSNPEQTLQTIEGMTPVLKTKEKAEAEENKDNQIQGIDTNEKKKEFEGQLTQLEAIFTLDKIAVHIDESMKENNEEAPFLRLTLESIVAQTKIKTFDMEFDASLANLIVYHEQFIGKDNQQLRLLSAQLEQNPNNDENQKLVSVNFLHTSPENPLFLTSDYNGIENRAHVHFSKLVVTLQLEALLSILRFQDSLMKQLPQDTPENQEKKKQEEEMKKQQEQKNTEDNKNIDKTTGKVVQKKDVPAAPSLKIDADLEEFRIILASKQAKLFDIQVQGVKAYVSQAPEKTLVNLILSDLCILDPYKDARYRKIISQQGDDKELLRVDLSLFNYPEGYQKAIDVFDCDVKVQFAKANIVFLFKHIDAILGFLDSLNITKAALNIASTQADAAYEQVQKLQEQAFKVHLDITFNAPNIIIPTNSYSDQALFLDLGKLILKTNFYDDPRKSLVEQQNIRFENMLASRVKLDRDCNILGEAILLECAELNTLINRLLYPDKVKTEPGVSIKVDWKLVHFQLAKDDYSCVMRVLMENFSENIRDQIPEGFQNEQYRYRQEAQEKEEEKLRAAVIKKQKESCGTEVLPTLKLRAEIKKLALTLYLGESDMSVRRGPRNDNLKLANVQIDTFEALFRQRSDGSYKATARVKNFLLDDLRATNKSSSVTRMMDRHFTVDPNTHMFVASFEFNPKNQSRPTALRQLTAQLESLYISISLDYLMILQDFFISGLPSGNAETPRQVEQQAITTTEQSNNDQNRTKMDKKPTPVTSKTSVAPSKPTTTQTTTASNADTELETRIDVSVKNPEIILLEDQHNSNSNCLVLDLALQLRMITIGTNTQLYGWLKNLTVYSSNFAELRESNNSGSKIKYRNVEQFALKPSQLYLVTSGSRSSSLLFTIPSYDNIKWISEPVDLKVEGKGDFNEHIVIFRNKAASNPQQILRMVLRVDTFHESYRLLFYSPLWILNRTDLKLEFQIENNRTFIDVIERPHLVCPEKIGSEANKKGQICVYGVDQGDAAAKWSEKFSLGVIKSTGLTSCRVPNDQIYMICVDIATSSFGLTKLVTLSPAMVVINKSTVGIEVVETVSNEEQGKWETINPEQLIPFWPRNIKESVMRVRYTHNQITSSPFNMNQKHRTLLRMEDEECPAIYVEVAATDFDSVKVIFEDYKIGDAPLLIVNSLENEPVSFCQVNDVRTQILPPSNYVYYTWTDPILPRELTVSCRSKSAKIGFTVRGPQRSTLGKEGSQNVTYTVFIDGIQTVLLFFDDEKTMKSASKTLSMAESMDQRIQIGIHDIGVSIVNDITREEMLYISLNKSKLVWTEMKSNRCETLSRRVNAYLEELYTTHLEQCEMNPDNKELQKKKYQMEGFQEVSFDDETAELVDSKTNRKKAQRQALDGLWIEYAWSASDSAIHIRINRVQIDNQLDYTTYPVMLHPSVTKETGPDYAEKPFIESSVYQSKIAQSNIMQFKFFFQMLIQEFAVQIDQGSIVAILNFLKPENTNAAPTINMNTDLEQIQKPLNAIIKAQIESPSGETEMFFDNIHLSPLKIHVSFSMHGSNPSEELLAEYPLVGFLLQTLNVAEVQDVILRLGYYERNDQKFTTTKIKNEVSSHYQNQFMKQIHVLVLGLDVLGNPLGVIRGLAEGVESFFYQPYNGAIEGPLEFAEGVATGFRALFGSVVGGAAGAASKITSAFGKGLASLAFDEDYKISRIRRKEPGATATSHIAIGGKNVVMGFVDGVKGMVKKPIRGAKHGGASGFFKGLGQGVVGLVARPTGGVVDFASTSLDLIKRTAQQEEIVRRIRYPRHVGSDGIVRPYIAHEAMGFYILNRLEDGNYAKSDTYVAHINCSENPLSWLMATSKRLLFVTEISFLGLYGLDWKISYEDLKEEPIIKINTNQIQILTKKPKAIGTIRSHTSFRKLVKFKTISDAKYIVDKIESAMHAVGL
ncbi:unnamed protein product [Rotaria sp. Silwood2]|nr:unnamed protein product [Rotaria sp. Silwood2]